MSVGEGGFGFSYRRFISGLRNLRLYFVLNYNFIGALLLFCIIRLIASDLVSLRNGYAIGVFASCNGMYHMVFGNLIGLMPARSRHYGRVDYNVNFQRRVLGFRA